MHADLSLLQAATELLVSFHLDDEPAPATELGAEFMGLI